MYLIVTGLSVVIVVSDAWVISWGRIEAMIVSIVILGGTLSTCTEVWLLALTPLLWAISTATCVMIPCSVDWDVVARLLMMEDVRKAIALLLKAVPGVVDSIMCEELLSNVFKWTCGATPKRAPIVNAYRFFMMNDPDKTIALMCRFAGLPEMKGWEPLANV